MNRVTINPPPISPAVSRTVLASWPKFGLYGSNVKGGRTTTTTNQEDHISLISSDNILIRTGAPPIRPAVAKPVLASCLKFGLYSSNLKGGGWTTTTTNDDDHLLLMISVHILITMGAPPTSPAVANPVLESCPKFGLYGSS